MPFARVIKGEGVNLWAIPATADYTMACHEGQLRALAVLQLQVQGEGPDDRAAAMGRILGRIAASQVENRENNPNDSAAIREFWGLIGQFAAAYASREGAIDFALRAVTRRLVSGLACETGMLLTAKREAQERARKAAKIGAAKRRKAAKRGKAVRS